MPAQLLGDISLNGYPGAASGSVRFYQPTTLIPVVVYSNDAATSAITQPVPLDANGRSAVPIYVTKMVRMIISDVNGATLQDIERADGLRAENTSLVNTSWSLAASEDAAWTLLATSLGGTNGLFKASGVGAGTRSIQAKLSEQISVKDFGAKGDGITDDTGAINSALAAAAILGGGSVFFPAGTYIISQAIAITQSNLLLQGVGPTASIIKNNSSSGNAFAISGNTASNITFANIGIATSTTSTGVAVLISGVTQTAIAFNTCSISGHRTGISHTGIALTGMTIFATQITTDNNAASVCVNVLAGLQIVVYGGLLQAGTSIANGVCVTLGGSGDFFAFGVSWLGATGVSTAGGNFTIFGGDVGGVFSLNNLYLVTGGTPKCTAIGAPAPLTTPTALARSILISPITGGAWGDAGSYLTTNVGTTSGYTVDVTSYRTHRVVATAAGITITISAPASQYAGAYFTVIMANNSGGAVTWAFAASYRVAAVAPATGNQVAVTFLYNGTNQIEAHRGSVVAI